MSKFLFMKATKARNSLPEVFSIKGALRNFAKDTCARASFLKKLQVSFYNYIKTETLARVFSCEFFKISKNLFYCRTSLVVISV